MIYLPLSVDAEESANYHWSVGKSNLLMQCRNIVDAMLYKGDDNPLTNWAYSNNMNMLHLVRFLKNARYNYNYISDRLILSFSSDTISALNSKNILFDLREGETMLNGRIAFTVNTHEGFDECGMPKTKAHLVQMHNEEVKGTRDPFVPVMPIPVEADWTEDKYVWYCRLYYYMISSENACAPHWFSVSAWQKHLTKDVRDQFATNLNTIVNEMEDLL